MPVPLAVKPEDRAVLVTGANSGFGLACVIEIAKRGYRAIGSVRSEKKAQELKSAAAAAGVTVDVVIMDVTDVDACEQVMAQLPLYGLVNNAGFGVVGAVEDIADEAARHALETMVVAPIRLARLAIPSMRERGEGRIICMSSMYGRTTIPLNGWYQATKHALEAVSDALRVEIARDGIDTVLVEPGVFKTGIFDEGRSLADQFSGSRYNKVYEAYSRLVGQVERKAPTPEPVARLVVEILDTKRPKPRYLIGKDAFISIASDKIIPVRIKDRIMRAFYKL